MPPDAARRWFFVPSRGGGWELVEATDGADGWEVRRPGRIGFDRFDAVPPPGADWVEAREPKRAPRLPASAPAAKPSAAAPAPVQGAGTKPRTMTRPPPPKGKAHPAEPKALPRKAVPNLSQELEDLLLKEQRSQAVPAGKVQCPLCGVILDPMRAKKVRTHDNPVTGTRCAASGRPWAEFGAPPPT